MASREAKLFGRNRVSITGDKEARAALKKLGAKIRREIVVPALEKAMEPVFRRAQSETPRGTGYLVSKLTEKTAGKSKGRILVDVRVDQVPYGGFEELGTKKFEGNHAMQRTWDATRAGVQNAALRGIADGIEARS